MSRREKIEAMLADDPGDTFFATAWRWSSTRKANTMPAWRRFAELTRDDPPYVPAFFMAGQQLVRLGRIDEARTILRDGIAAARIQGDLHAAGEMSEFLASLEDAD